MVQLVNLNTAPIEQLKTIQGVGEATAKKIVSERGPDGKALTMIGLVTNSKVAREKWVELVVQGVITMNVTDDDLVPVPPQKSMEELVQEQVTALSAQMQAQLQAMQKDWQKDLQESKAQTAEVLQRLTEKESELKDKTSELDYLGKFTTRLHADVEKAEGLVGVEIRKRRDLEDRQNHFVHAIEQVSLSCEEAMGIVRDKESQLPSRFSSGIPLMGYSGLEAAANQALGFQGMAMGNPSSGEQVDTKEASPEQATKQEPLSFKTESPDLNGKVPHPKTVSVADDPNYNDVLSILDQRNRDTNSRSHSTDSKGKDKADTSRFPKPDTGRVPKAEYSKPSIQAVSSRKPTLPTYQPPKAKNPNYPDHSTDTESGSEPDDPRSRGRGHERKYADKGRVSDGDKKSRHHKDGRHRTHDRDRGRDRDKGHKDHQGRGGEDHRRDHDESRDRDHGREKGRDRKESHRDDTDSEDYLTGSDTSLDFTTTSSSNSSSESGSGDRRHRHRHGRGKHKKRNRGRARSPPAPKLPSFHGETNKWRAFIYQFSETAKTHRWSRQHRLEKLKACLRDKAMEYVHNLHSHVKYDYKELKKALTKRYGQKDPPSYARRQMYSMKQLDQETIEDYADRVLRLVLDGFPKAPEDITQQVAVETFLHGCREKAAAFAASEKSPKTLTRALRYVKSATQNLRYMGKSAYTSRQVSFDLGSKETITEDMSVRSVSPVPSNSRPREGSRNVQLNTKELAQELSTSLSESLLKIFAQYRSRSQSPNKESVTCYSCNRKGHYSNECPSKKPGGAPKSPPPGSPSRGTCFTCGDSRHFQRDCPKRNRSRSPSPASQGKGGAAKT
jgi:hypothetical protein